MSVLLGNGWGQNPVKSGNRGESATENDDATLFL